MGRRVQPVCLVFFSRGLHPSITPPPPQASKQASMLHIIPFISFFVGCRFCRCVCVCLTLLPPSLPLCPPFLSLPFLTHSFSLHILYINYSSLIFLIFHANRSSGGAVCGQRTKVKTSNFPGGFNRRMIFYGSVFVFDNRFSALFLAAAIVYWPWPGRQRRGNSDGICRRLGLGLGLFECIFFLCCTKRRAAIFQRNQWGR